MILQLSVPELVVGSQRPEEVPSGGSREEWRGFAKATDVVLEP